jgi:hypothetical protein
MSLINDMLLRAGIIDELSRSEVMWFHGIRTIDVVFTYILPLLFMLSIAIYLKIRYNKRKLRDELTLRPFLKLDPPLAPVV